MHHSALMSEMTLHCVIATFVLKSVSLGHQLYTITCMEMEHDHWDLFQVPKFFFFVVNFLYARLNSKLIILRCCKSHHFFTRGQFWPSGIVIACVCGSVCVCINHELVRTITHHPVKLGSPNLDQRCKTPWFGSLLFLGMIDLDLQGQI